MNWQYVLDNRGKALWAFSPWYHVPLLPLSPRLLPALLGMTPHNNGEQLHENIIITFWSNVHKCLSVKIFLKFGILVDLNYKIKEMK